MIDCQKLEFSPSLARARIEKVGRILGLGVLRRLLCFVLYLLGVNRRAVAEALEMPPDSAKSIIKAVERGGLPALEDRRRRTSTFRTPPEPKAPEVKVRQEDPWMLVDFGMPGPVLRVPTADPLHVKVVLLSLLNSGLIAQKEVAQVLGYSREHTRNLAQKLQVEGVPALLDKRKGQTQDYRVGVEAKAELIQQFVLAAVGQGRSSGRGLSEDLQARCKLTIPERTVRHHLKKLGLSRIKESLPELLAGVKKNSSAPSKT